MRAVHADRYGPPDLLEMREVPVPEPGAREGFDFVLDAVGKADGRQARRLLKPEGVVSASDFGPGGRNLWLVLRSPLMRERRFVFPLPKRPRAAVATAAALLERGELRAGIDRAYRLEEIVEAYRYVETGQKTGIVVIELVGERD